MGDCLKLGPWETGGGLASAGSWACSQEQPEEREEALGKGGLSCGQGHQGLMGPGDARPRTLRVESRAGSVLGAGASAANMPCKGQGSLVLI